MGNSDPASKQPAATRAEGVSDVDSKGIVEKETLALECSWFEGRLLSHIDRLISFVKANRQKILELAGGSQDERVLLTTAMAFVRQTGSVDLLSELKDQAREIHSEIWIRGERGDYDRRRIQREWTVEHAAAWREWRIKEYLFVAERCAPQIVAVLRLP
jgi:hypothetical protein